MATVNIMNPVPPHDYVEVEGPGGFGKAVERVRNGCAVFWRIVLPNGKFDYGLFSPSDGFWGGGVTPPHATLLWAPGDGSTSEKIPGLPQYLPTLPDYPVVKSGDVVFDINSGGFKVETNSQASASHNG